MSYTIKNTARTSKIVISIRADGTVVVSKSPRIPIVHAERAVREKIEWIKEKLREQESRPKKLLAHFSVKDFKEHKEAAREQARARLEHFNDFYNHQIGKICIRNQRSRWGSCSAKGNLNFNYKIMFLPAELRDYIIVHELCHLKEMNHSPRFWALVARTMPEYKAMRTRIRSY